MVNAIKAQFLGALCLFVSASAAIGDECHPSYVNVCLPVNGPDVDCSSGRGDGPIYVEGPVIVDGPDPYGLDRDKDGIGCENG